MICRFGSNLQLVNRGLTCENWGYDGPENSVSNPSSFRGWVHPSSFRGPLQGPSTPYGLDSLEIQVPVRYRTSNLDIWTPVLDFHYPLGSLVCHIKVPSSTNFYFIFVILMQKFLSITGIFNVNPLQGRGTKRVCFLLVLIQFLTKFGFGYITNNTLRLDSCEEIRWIIFTTL